MTRLFKTTRDAASPQPAPSGQTGQDSTSGARQHVDWNFASASAGRLVPSGPKASRIEIKDAVAQLRSSALEAVEPVAQTTGMSAPPDAAGALVVDRPGWIRANTASLESMVGPVIDSVMARRSAQETGGRGPAEPSELGQRVGGVVSGAEVAGLLSWVSTKVLGQYDLAPAGVPRLLLVAPNIMAAERELEVDRRDFRLWVCLHEETHRVQFTAVPWLRQHIIDSARSLSTSMAPTPSELGERMGALVTGLPSVLRGETDITTLLANQEQRAELARITAVMSLLEGHADVVMDDVGPQVIPSVAEIRAKFTERRAGAGVVDVLLRRLLGMEAKMRQYRDGAVFVRAVIDRVGIEGFNQVWSDPEALPRAAEIADPAAWVARVHG
ncbi:MAG TPA: zinc-dependent metalloprotease [Ornithinimicrobium sp.]|uniref:zinc-dependent metalloprotease n=1 Tax=Ornithinimicrobium sp. TaxID=1977084 RepID=UPI002B4A8929|nr:zinc-dependent metalloprotease [Ornithinimicrobium sp.]HKJ12916.1 zinc-dependent metalloprotease [Ornithinimicrobium sp.]